MGEEALHCTSCGKKVAYQKALVSFLCPNCGEGHIVRCDKCRQQVNDYICSICAFEGP